MTTPTPTPAPAPAPTVAERWPRRAPWLRVVLIAGFLLSLPLQWIEETPSGCGARPGPPVVKTGWELVTRDSKAMGMIAFLMICGLALLALSRARRAGSGTRLAAHVVATATGALLFVLVHFAATFTLFARLKLLPGALVGLCCLALATVEALTRAIGELLALVAARRRRRLDDPPHRS